MGRPPIVHDVNNTAIAISKSTQTFFIHFTSQYIADTDASR